jgi:hypothetical protein
MDGNGTKRSLKQSNMPIIQHDYMTAISQIRVVETMLNELGADEHEKRKELEDTLRYWKNIAK